MKNTGEHVDDTGTQNDQICNLFFPCGGITLVKSSS